MKISGEYQLANSRAAVWQALNDPDVLRRCIPGCESLASNSETELDANIAAVVGPVRATFRCKLSLQNLNPPASYTLTGEGKAGASGFGRGYADVVLSESHGGTLLSYEADFKVGGKLAQVGSRLVLGATRKTADEFFGAFARELDPGATRLDEDIEAGVVKTGIPPTVIKAAGLAVLLLQIWWIFLK